MAVFLATFIRPVSFTFLAICISNKLELPADND